MRSVCMPRGGRRADGTEAAQRASKPKAEKAAKAKAAFKTPAKAKAKSKSAKKGKAASKRKGKAMRAKATDVASYGYGVCSATFGSQTAAINHALGHTS